MSELSDSERVFDFDGSDRDAREGQEKDAEFREAQRRTLLIRLLRDPVAREWLWSLLREFRTFETAFGISPAGFPDPLATAHYGGMKQAGWRIWTELDDVAPELASLMRREHK